MFPLQATYSRQVLHHAFTFITWQKRVVGFPHLRLLCLIRLPFNQGPSTSASVPLPELDKLRVTHRPVSGFPLRASVSSSLIYSTGVEWASQVLVCISSYMPRLVNSAGPSHPCLYRMILYCLRCTLQPSASGTCLFRSDASTSGSAVSPAAYMILCVRFVWVVRHHVYPSQSRNTRYGWMASPYPSGTFTLIDAPSFAWRANIRIHKDVRKTAAHL